MKTLVMILVFAMPFTKLFAQDYLISFSASGDTNAVATVIIDNLRSGENLLLNGDEVLHLVGAVGINLPASKAETIELYPNPVTEVAHLTVIIPESGQVKVDVFDISGRNCCSSFFHLSMGVHTFDIVGLVQGIYTIQVTAPDFNQTVKCISQKNGQGKIKITTDLQTLSSLSLKSKNVKTVIEMPYEEGDQLLFKGISGRYSTIVPLVATGNQSVDFNFVGVTDADGNNYSTVYIGQDKSAGQTWITDNLIVTHYRNGDPIDYVTDDATWFNLTTGAYCWYNNDEATYKVPYGGLYNGYAVNDSRNLCPSGWHVPSYAEWTMLINFLGGMDVAGGKLKTTGSIEDGTGTWHAPNSGATNETGFAGQPAGIRHYLGYSEFIGSLSYQWSSTVLLPFRDGLYCFTLNFESAGYYWGASDMKNGQSVRCVKD